MELPLIARIREEIHEKHLKNNIGTIYGADYIGAGIGAAIWVLFLLTIDISKASALTAALNLCVGTVFIIYYWHRLNWKKTIVGLHIVLFIIVGIVYQQGNTWLNQMSNLLYIDKVVYSDKTRFQQLTFTQRYMGADQSNVISFYLNGRLQFTSSDEFIYHSYLVTPVLAGSARHNNILIVGGGDGLALRDVLQWAPDHVTLIDLDDELIDIFTTPEDKLPPKLAKYITELNQKSLQDKKVNVIKSDAFIAIDELLAQGKVFDAIIVDLPDPSHPDLNKLYSVNFYARLKQMLAGDGLIGIQSTSPYHAKNSFISVMKTLEAANYSSVQQYHDNVPSFGEWGWTIASKMGASPLQRLKALDELPVEHFWLTLPMIQSAFEFPHNFYRDREEIPINYLGSHAIYQLHQNAWQDQQGLNNSHLQQ
jgi:spermidine synthase